MCENAGDTKFGAVVKQCSELEKWCNKLDDDDVAVVAIENKVKENVRKNR